MHLIVTTPFADYAKGERITDAETVASVAESHPAHVVRVAEIPIEPAPAAPEGI